MRRKHLSLALAVAIMLGWYVLLRPAVLGGSVTYIKVSGPSMEPTLSSGDFALVRRDRTYRPGDVIAYRAEEGVVIHRIVGGTPEEGYVTRGDNRTTDDPWRPRPEHILGRLWFHVPDLGALVHRLQQPALFAAAAGAFTAVSVLAARQVRAGRRRRRRGAPGAPRRMLPGVPLSSGALMVAAAGFGAAALAFSALAAYAFWQPASEARTVHRDLFTHTVRFDYTAAMEPSPLYPGGTVASPLQAEGAAPPAPVPLFRRLARTLDLGVTYQALGEGLTDVRGEYSARLEIAAEDAWRHSLPLVPPTPFEGPAVAFRVPVDLQRVFAFLDEIQRQTGFAPRSYDLRVVPSVQVAGRLHDRPVTGAYGPPFTMRLDAVHLALDQVLTRTEPEQEARTVQAGRHAGLPYLPVPVTALRAVGVVGAAVSLAAAAAAAAAVLRRLGRESERIRMRFGSRLVAVSRADFHGDEQRIRVASMQDLVRLAEQDGRMILHLEEPPGFHVFAIPDGLVLYEYVVDERPPELTPFLSLRRGRPDRLASSS